MSEKVIGPETLADWFRRIGTKLSRDDYEDGIAAMHENRQRIEKLTESNRKLANQSSGYSDRVQESLRPLLADAKVEALREAADELSDMPGAQESHINWLRAHADVVEAS